MLKKRLNRIRIVKVKLSLIKQFLGERLQLKGSLYKYTLRLYKKGQS